MAPEGALLQGSCGSQRALGSGLRDLLASLGRTRKLRFILEERDTQSRPGNVGPLRPGRAWGPVREGSDTGEVRWAGGAQIPHTSVYTHVCTHTYTWTRECIRSAMGTEQIFSHSLLAPDPKAIRRTGTHFLGTNRGSLTPGGGQVSSLPHLMCTSLQAWGGRGQR